MLIVFVLFCFVFIIIIIIIILLLFKTSIYKAGMNKNALKLIYNNIYMVTNAINYYYAEESHFIRIENNLR